MTAKRKLMHPRLPRGFEDRSPGEIAAVDAMLHRIREVYERYGFDPVETPVFEYTEALGKFLPDTDRPNAGVFSLQDDDEQWLSLRYDLTAPLARFFAENFERLPKPYRSYRLGWVFRNEKPGPGRFRQFMQFDADTVGAAGPEADAEMCMMLADVMDALGLAGKYIVKVNNRKVLDGVLVSAEVTDYEQKLAVLRAIDKLDKFGTDGVRLLLGEGRKDDSGDFTRGAGLLAAQQQIVLDFISGKAPEQNEGVSELQAMEALFRSAGYGDDRIEIDPSIVRGLEYYTGPVFEVVLTFPVTNEKGQEVIFGAVGSGGRYDGLVSRFRSESVPATGCSIGVSRLAHALQLTGNLAMEEPVGPVVVLVLDKEQTPRYQEIVSRLRNAGIRAEMFMGATKNFGKQVQYADRRNSPAVVIEGSDERARGIVQIKDLVAGKEAAAAIADNRQWKVERPGQFECRDDEIVERIAGLPAVRAALEKRR